jgi:hypothetical protein
VRFAEIRELILKPPSGYGPLPFWAMNASLSPEVIRGSLEDLKDKGIEEIIIHPRSGLEVEYLSEDFWLGMDRVIVELQRLGMRGWIYDEYNWPSGAAGGKLFRSRPDFIQSGLDFDVLDPKKAVQLKGPLVAAFEVGNSYRMVPHPAGERLFSPPRPGRGYLVFWKENMLDRTFATHCAPWARGERGVLDYLRSGGRVHGDDAPRVRETV